MRRTLALLIIPLLLVSGCIGAEKDVPTAEAEPVPLEPAATPDGGSSAGAPANETPSAASPTSSASPESNVTQTTQPEAEPAPLPRIDVLRWDGIASGAGLGAVEPQPGLCCASAAAQGTGAETFDVPDGVKGIVIELVWDHEAMDLDLRVTASDFAQQPDPAGGSVQQGHAWSAADGAPGAPDGRAVITITDPDALALAGTWTWEALAKGAAHEATYQVVVSLFLDEAPPDGYAAPSEKP